MSTLSSPSPVLYRSTVAESDSFGLSREVERPEPSTAWAREPGCRSAGDLHIRSISFDLCSGRTGSDPAGLRGVVYTSDN